VTLRPGISIFTLRATARLRAPDGSFSDVVRTAAAVVQLTRPLPGRPRIGYPVHVLRWYDDAWSQAIVPPDEHTSGYAGNVGLIQQIGTSPFVPPPPAGAPVP